MTKVAAVIVQLHSVSMGNGQLEEIYTALGRYAAQASRYMLTPTI